MCKPKLPFNDAKINNKFNYDLKLTQLWYTFWRC